MCKEAAAFGVGNLWTPLLRSGGGPGAQWVPTACVSVGDYSDNARNVLRAALSARNSEITETDGQRNICFRPSRVPILGVD